MVEAGISEKSKYLVKLVAVTAAVYFCVEYLLPIFLPFLIAYLLKLILRPMINWLETRWGLKRKIVTVVLLVLITGILISLVVSFAGVLSVQIKKLIQNSEYYEEKVDKVTNQACIVVEKYSGIESQDIKHCLDKGVEQIFEFGQDSEIVYIVMNKSVSTIRILIEWIVLMITTILAAYYMLAGSNIKKEKKENKQKEMWLNEIRGIARRVTSVCSAYVKTQLIIMSITFVICLISFLIIQNEYAFLIALIVGALDALPLIGVGVILVPWGIICLLMGNYFNAIVILLAFVVCYFAREVLEPRLMGNQIGITPLMTIASMYVGYKVFGIIGVVLGPICYIVISGIME
ncbi:MAG: sporulation integral membrane protein YtvI [Lachnospiraceae bacterium]|nr:sporulation integral membrane protein YtvI [Lachnospiraceae bacterium]